MLLYLFPQYSVVLRQISIKTYPLFFSERRKYLFFMCNSFSNPSESYEILRICLKKFRESHPCTFNSKKPSKRDILDSDIRFNFKSSF